MVNTCAYVYSSAVFATWTVMLHISLVCPVQSSSARHVNHTLSFYMTVHCIVMTGAGNRDTAVYTIAHCAYQLTNDAVEGHSCVSADSKISNFATTDCPGFLPLSVWVYGRNSSFHSALSVCCVWDLQQKVCKLP